MTISTYDSTGISLIKYADILANAIAASEASWDESTDTTINDAQDAFLGHLLRNISLKLNDINEILQDIYDSGSVANATGTRLDFLLSLIGISRPSDSASTATITLTSSKAVTVPAGSKYKTSAGVIFSTDSELVFTGAGTGDVATTCTIYGPNAAAIGEINTIVTSIDGITAVTNAAAASPGRYRAGDAEQKASHTIAVSTSGKSDAASIYEALTALDGVSGVSVLENDTEETIGLLPAHNIHCIVVGGTGADIVEAIHQNKVSGVTTFGSTTVSHYDTTTKQAKNIKYDIGDELPIYISFDVELIEGQYDTDWETQLRDNLITHFEDFRIGQDVIHSALYGPIYTVNGIIATNLKIDTTTPPANTGDETMLSTELATFTLANAATHLSITEV